MTYVTDDVFAEHAWKFAPSSVVQHRNGNWYKILACAFVEATKDPVYVYQRTSGGATWTRPQAEFEDGRFTPKPSTDFGDK